MPGYALLPNLENPTSRMTFRLSEEEMEERNAWILEADRKGFTVVYIANEVGLSEQRVKQIIKQYREPTISDYNKMNYEQKLALHNLIGHMLTMTEEQKSVILFLVGKTLGKRFS